MLKNDRAEGANQIIAQAIEAIERPLMKCLCVFTIKLCRIQS